MTLCVAKLTDKETIMVHVDFNENYDDKQSVEVQSAYFGDQKVSLYTCCVYYHNYNERKTKSFVMVAHCNNHCHEVKFCLIIKILQQDAAFPLFDTITFCSDGCANQF